MNVPADPDSGVPKDSTSGSDAAESAEERADTDPMLNSANPYGAGWGAGWGASWAEAPERPGDEPSARADRLEPSARPAERTPTPVLGDLELPSAPEPFAFPTEPPRSSTPAAGRMVALAVGGFAALAAVIGLVLWLVNRSPSASDAQQTGTTTEPTTGTASGTATGNAPTRDAGAESRLMRMLPPGYPPGACKPADPQPGSVSKINCDNNVDADGPSSGTYLLARDRAALDAAFAAAVRPDAIVTCPGNIQSPGPWRRNATPQKVSGTLVCAVQDGVPTVAWTDTDRMLVSVVRSDSPGPTLDQLYQWWSGHS